jgi:hypothetical protein
MVNRLNRFDLSLPLHPETHNRVRYEKKEH